MKVYISYVPLKRKDTNSFHKNALVMGTFQHKNVKHISINDSMYI